MSQKKHRLSVKQIKQLVGNPITPSEAIDSLYELLKSKERWVQCSQAVKRRTIVKDTSSNDGNLHDETDLEDGEMFCLIGAVHRVNGPSEKTIQLALALAINKLHPGRYRLVTEDHLSLDFSEDDLQDVIIMFNDDEATEHKDVRRAIREARRLVPVIEEFAAEADLLDRAKHDVLWATEMVARLRARLY